jgi:hypothetical protein
MAPNPPITSIFSRYFFYILVPLLLFNLNCAKAQNTLITLVDSTKVKADIVSVSDRLLFTQAGNFNLTEVYSVLFSTDAEYRKMISAAVKLLDFGVIVSVAGIQQPPSDPVKVATNRKRANDSKDDTVPIASSSNSINDYSTLVSLGIGFGQDYGGYGARLTVLPNSHFGIFFGGGYALAGFGYNAGAMVIAKPDKKVSATFMFMYGYTAAIAVSGASQYNKIYYGPSIGGGIRSTSRKNEQNYWQFGITLPFRPSEFDSDFDRLKSNSSIVGLTKPWPITISVGYHFVF